MLAVQEDFRTAYAGTNNFYPTPPHLTERLLAGITVHPGDVLLEPSAGAGHIASVLQSRFPTNLIDCVEVEPLLQEILTAKGLRVFRGSIFDYHEPADVIVANFPFCDDFQDVDHFMHCWSLLRPGGRIACIVHEYTAFPHFDYGKPFLFSRFLTAIGAKRERLGAGAFSTSDRPTNTSTAMIWATKRS